MPAFFIRLRFRMMIFSQAAVIMTDDAQFH